MSRSTSHSKKRASCSSPLTQTQTTAGAHWCGCGRLIVEVRDRRRHVGMKTRRQRAFEAQIHNRNRDVLAHPAEPIEGDLWSTPCQRVGCDRVFVSASRQRKYCSDECRRMVEVARHRQAEHVAWLMLRECDAPACTTQFPRTTAHTSKRYCSEVCRKRAYRATTDLTPRRCLNCGKLLAARTRRAKYCDAVCRKRAHRERRKSC